ncbi:Predicted Zn-dependent peptidase [Hathewaya proteolytica DSM 3090]|uniref:Predicted Zn-dependent peptidase n=1 Tax=Hathewaya proteolytica DSM 3090 TaxID=1121331 RepID=A0A1M6LDS4_9CLOT|nr:pitrilysin family protein [Hathewaya proteolytica]SHJ69307.1 Predicted Zn-dependent peptidase [Hathewaya proteolytica DSM 3090]
MNIVCFKNGVRLIYKKSQSNLTSFCIGFEAGANKDPEGYYGIAHAVEHMVYKGTNTKDEHEINEKIDELFGFSNAMTNYPYVVYYGTCLSEDFQQGFKLHSDFLIHPAFSEKGFKEEMDVIKEELKEWKEDAYQHCEDLCFYHGFKKKRVRELIIGNCETLENIALEDIREFHKKHYVGENCVVSVTSNLDLDIIIDIVEDGFRDIKPQYCEEHIVLHEVNAAGIFKDEIGSESCKINFVYSLDNLTSEEIMNFRVFNNFFAEGVSSLLYNEIRTKRGLSYEVGAKLKDEKGVEIYKIYLGTSSEKADVAVEVVNQLIYKIKNNIIKIKSETIDKAIKNLKLKQSIDLEKSIVHSFRLCIMEIMGDKKDKKLYCSTSNDNNFAIHDYISPLYYDELCLNTIDEKTILAVVNKVLKDPTIEIMT